MQELTSEKKKIIDEHFSNILEAHTNMLKQINDSIRNYKAKVGGDVSFYEKVKTALTFDRSNLLNLRPEDMLEYSKMWFDTAKQNFNTIIQISNQEYASLQEQIGKQFEIAQKSIFQVEEELKDVKDEQKKNWLQRKKQDIVERSW